MDTEMYNWFMSAPENGAMSLIFIGFIFYLVFDLLICIIEFLKQESWRVSDYEKTLYYLYDNFFNKNMDVKSAIVNATHSSGSHSLEGAYISYSEKLERKNNYKKYFSKIKNFFKR